MTASSGIEKAKRGIEARASILGGLVTLLWTLEIIDLVLPGRPLDAWGIRPRQLGSLVCILTAPFLHVGFGHLVANTIPLVILGWLVMLKSTDDFWRVVWSAVFVGGAGTWLFGAPGTIHLGASGIVFGFIGFLLFRGFFERSLAWIVVAIVVAVLYGGALWGFVFIAPGISWTGHVFGFVGGVLAARRYRR